MTRRSALQLCGPSACSIRYGNNSPTRCYRGPAARTAPTLPGPDKIEKHSASMLGDCASSLPPAFNRLAWSNLAAQSAEQVASRPRARSAAGLAQRDSWRESGVMDSSSMIGLVIVGLAIGPVALVLLLLNARDRRRDRAASVILGACNTPSLRGWVSLRVRASLLSRRAVACLDIPAGAADEVWPTIRRLAASLPPGLTLVVDTRLAGALPVIVTLRQTPGAHQSANSRARSGGRFGSGATGG